MSNKYLEKIAVVAHAVKAQRRLAQLLAEKSHDFHQASTGAIKKILDTKTILPGKGGTHGAGIYSGRGAPAHEYQLASPGTSSSVAYPGNPAHAIPHSDNLRFHGFPKPVQDSLRPTPVSLDRKSTYVVLPGSAPKKGMHPGEKDLHQQMEPSIRSSGARRLYSDDLHKEIDKRGLSDSHWDAGRIKKRPGQDFQDHVRDKLWENASEIPKADSRKSLKMATGENRILKNIYTKDLFKNRHRPRKATQIKEDLHSTGLASMSQNGYYKKYNDKGWW